MQKLELNHNHYISYRQHKTIEEDNPTIIFLHGLMSDKDGTKALSAEKYCIENNYNFVTFDNLGHGESSGNFTEFSMEDWLLAANQLFQKLNLKNIILVGSSMGGWLALLLALSNLHDLKGLVLLAPAPDFTKKIWGNFNEQEQNTLQQGSNIYIKSPPEYPGIPISYNLIEGSKKHLLLERQVIKLNIPVTIIHGMQDKDVDYSVASTLTEKIECPYLCCKLIKYGGHRLSEAADLELINNSINEIINTNY